MKSRLMTLITTGVTTSITSLLITISSPAMALSDAFFVVGHDLDIISESNKTYAMARLEYELRKIPLFKEAKDLMFNPRKEASESNYNYK